MRTASPRCVRRPAPRRDEPRRRPEPRDGEIHVWRIRDNVYLLVGDEGNIVVQVGDEGAFVVDTGAGRLADKTLAEIRRLSDKPIQFIANTSSRAEHTGGNVKLRRRSRSERARVVLLAAVRRRGRRRDDHRASERAEPDGGAEAARPRAFRATPISKSGGGCSTTATRSSCSGSRNAVTDGDSIVHFRRADVIVAGDVFTTTQYPMIDVKNGGSVQGEIKALNDILNRTVYQHEGEGGTVVVPGHGYLSDEHEVVEYRDMVVIVRDRVQAMIKNGATLDQVKAARPTADYDTRYGATTGPWTTDMFVEAVYRDLNRR